MQGNDSDDRDVEVLEAYADYLASKIASTDITQPRVLALCMLLYTFETHEKPGHQAELKRAWQGMFHSAVHLLARHPERWGDARADSQAAEAAYKILHMLATSEGGVGSEGGYATWKETFNEKDSQVPDEMVEILRATARATTDEDGNVFWRVRRLEDLQESSDPMSVEGVAGVRTVSTDAWLEEGQDNGRDQ